jgi:hypothetical protein
MVSPVPQAVLEEEVAALLERILGLFAHEAIHELLGPRLQPDSQSNTGSRRQATLPTASSESPG